jgi:hypothetical protein
MKLFLLPDILRRLNPRCRRFHHRNLRFCYMRMTSEAPRKHRVATRKCFHEVACSVAF